MIDWSEVSYISPPVLQTLSNEELTRRLERKDIYLNWEYFAYPCHTVAVERLVKAVTEASSTVCGQSNRDGHIRAVLTSTEQMKTFRTKNHFVVS